MKILQIAPPWIATPPHGYGGTELVIYNLTEQLIKEGHQVTLFATKDSKTSAKLEYVFETGLMDQGVPWNGALPPLVHYQQAFKFFSENNFDIAHVHMSSQTDLMLLPFLSELKKPYVMTVHGHLPFDRYTNFDEFYFDLYSRKVSAVSLSKTMESFLPKQFKSDGFVYNSVDVESMTYNPNSGSHYVWLGRIVPDKGLHHAINVVKKTGEKLIFAGSVDKHNSDNGLDYFNNVIMPNVDGKQIQYLGEANFKMKNELFSNAKAFLNPIDWIEPFGMVMVESMACGTPVISFAKGAANELIIDGETGFLVKNEAEMIGAMKKVGSINRAACREHALRNFTAKAAAKGYLSIYTRKAREHAYQQHKTKTVIADATKNLFGNMVKKPSLDLPSLDF